MAKIKIKNSVTAGATPSGLSFGEVAVNITDKKIFIGNAVEGVVTLHDQQNIVTSVNGATGTVSDVAFLNANQSFVNLNTFDAITSFKKGITASNSVGSNVIDIIAATDGCGLRIGQADSGSNARIGGIRLGRSTSNNTNSYIENYVGQLKFFNGISGTNGNPGTNMLQLSTTNAIFGVPIAGATFTSTIGEVSIQKSLFGVNDSAYLRIIGTDNTSTLYSSDIKASSASSNTIHTLPSTTGTLLNTNSIINAATVTATTTNVNATRYLTFVGGAGDTGIFIDPTTTPLTYNPATGTIGAKKVILTTGSNVVTVDSVGGNVVLTDGANISTFGLDSFAASYIGPFTISNTLGLTLSSEAIAFEGTGYGYKFPSSNGSNGQVLTTNGAGTLSWTTVSGGGGGSATGFTYASSAPGTPSIGDRWIDSDTGKEYVYINDGSSSQWIEPVSSNGLVGVTYTPALNSLDFGVTGSFVKLGVGTTAPANTLDVSGGVSVSTTTNALDILATSDGAGMRIAQATSGAGSRIGGIRLGRNATASNNTYIESATGVFSIYNGIDQTGTNMFNIGISNGAVFNTPVSSTGAVTSDGGYRITSSAINAQTGTTYTLLASDNGKIITMSNGSAITLTVPSGLPIGFNTTVIQLGAGQVGITASSTTLNSFEGKLKLAGQHAAASIISYTTNVFNVAGGLTG